MKGLIASGLSLTLALWATATKAEELPWRAAGPRAVSLSRPQPVESPPTNATPANATPAVEGSTRPSLGRPSLGLPAPVVRLQNEEPRPLPTGPDLRGAAKADGGTTKKPATKNDPESIPVMPTPFPMTEAASKSVASTDGCGDPCGDGCVRFGRFHNLLNRCRSWWPDACGDPCAAPCDPCLTNTCCPTRPCWWIGASYLAWGINDQELPPLVTYSPPGTPLVNAGRLGFPTTNILYDQNNQENPVRDGFRVHGGFWFPRHDNFGMDATFFMLGNRDDGITFNGDGAGTLARPFVATNLGNTERAELVSTPGILNGNVIVSNSFEMWGLDVNFRHKWKCSQRGWCDILVGYRHLYIDEDLTITENLTTVGPGAPTGFVVKDQFGASNLFMGGQVGLQGEWRLLRRWYLGATAKLALGVVNQSVDIQGSTTFSNAVLLPGGPVTQPGGLLAQPSNSGHRSRNEFAVLPELGLKLGYNLTDNLRVFVGYDVLVLTSAVRPGNQIDRGVDTTQIPNLFGPGGPGTRPAPLFRSSDFWAQGVSFGLEYRY